MNKSSIYSICYNVPNLDGYVVGLCSARGEDDLLGVGADEGSDLAPKMYGCKVQGFSKVKEVN